MWSRHSVMVVVLPLQDLGASACRCTIKRRRKASMSRRIKRLALIAAVLTFGVLSLQAAVLDPLLQAKLGSTTGELIPAIVTYNNQPTAADLASLRLTGVRYGVALKQLPMVGVWATADQIRQLAASPSVRSVFLNRPLQYFNHEGSALI